MRFLLEHTNYITPEQLATNYPHKPTAISKLPKFQTPALDESYSYSILFQQSLSGKLLLRDEVPFPLSILHEHYQHGYLSYHPGITTEQGLYTCTRCGNDKQHLFAFYRCFRCRDTCVYCRDCVMLGRVSQCTPLLSWKGPDPIVVAKDDALCWDGQLSPGQQKASDKVVETVENGGELLVWAVCGAGKTEVLFAGIEKALSLGKRICIATPRTDVVLELAPRIRSVFPDIEILALYGGSPDNKKHSQVPVIISTTHQLVRYHNTFDVVVIDEVDAFPYSVDETLRFAVQRAKKENAAHVYLTATPSKQMKKRVKKGTLAAVKIPRRYHGYPLPVPRFVWCGNWKKQLAKSKLPLPIQTWLYQKQQENRQLFLFVPSIEIMEKVTKIIATCESVHAEDPYRHKKISEFRNGNIQLLVTTTILERGVTIPNLDVAVFASEEAVFSESALVQIAGRVGRSANAPTGDVVFFHFGKTIAMVEAKKHILMMNEEGDKNDLLSRLSQ